MVYEKVRPKENTNNSVLPHLSQPPPPFYEYTDQPFFERDIGNHSVQCIVESHALPINRSQKKIQRTVHERNYRGGGRVESVRPGEYLIWNFNINSSILKRGHRNRLSQIANQLIAALNQNPNWGVDIEGLASSSGTDPINNPLSTRRAQSVRRALERFGVPTARIRITSGGSSKSLPDISQENMARSRSVRVILAPRVAATQTNTTSSQTSSIPGSTTPQPQPPSRTPTPSPSQPSSQLPTTTPTTQPQCQVQAPNLNLDGGTVTLSRNRGQVVLQAGNGTASNLGMSFIGMVGLNPTGCGELSFVQNVQPFREVVYKDGTRLRRYTSSWHLDTEDPYPSWPLPINSSRITTRFSNDSPELGSGFIGSMAFTECLINTMEVRDDFRMYLMFTPTGGQRRTLLAATWSFIAQARNTTTSLCEQQTHTGGGSLVLDTSISRIIPSSAQGTQTSQSPIISSNVTSVRFQIDRGGRDTTRTFADLFEPILNGAGGRRGP